LELKARIKAILRRITPSEGAKTKIEYGNISLDYNQRKIIIDGNSIDLTSKEFDLIDLFLSNPDKVYSRENLLDLIWGYDYPGDARTVDVHVRRLREKIEPSPSDPKYVHTKWGVGYFFRGDK
jgi:DNA-binding response OmpR family regulator